MDKVLFQSRLTVFMVLILFVMTAISFTGPWVAPSVSVSPLSSMAAVTAPDGWKMAMVSSDTKKFTIFYMRYVEENFDWGTGTNGITKTTYSLRDETNPPKPTDHCWSSDAICLVNDPKWSSAFDLPTVCILTLNKKTFFSKSGLQSIIVNNSKKVGENIFRQIYNGLEKIENK